ncbi:hypothetical protein [Dankookia rubra]|uniref:hypothetical protein n=1 Tax=Dankookia rubra TaxID=1442381 RepID=UPI001407C3E6|nr:hypothetical protein [Dankookia rubra]
MDRPLLRRDPLQGATALTQRASPTLRRSGCQAAADPGNPIDQAHGAVARSRA